MARWASRFIGATCGKDARFLMGSRHSGSGSHVQEFCFTDRCGRVEIDQKLPHLLVHHVPLEGDSRGCANQWWCSGVSAQAIRRESSPSRVGSWYHVFIFMVLGSIPALSGALVSLSAFICSSSNSRSMLCRENPKAS